MQETPSVFAPRPRRLAGPLALILALFLVGLAAAAPLSRSGLVFVVRNGSSSTGMPLYEVADSSDAAVNRLWEKVHTDPEVLRAASIYMQIQEARKEEVRKELIADGQLSAQDQAILDDLPDPQPVYVEVKPGTAGGYNDWKARFTVAQPGGSQETVTAPRVVFTTNDPVAVGGDRELFAQTLVHEISHGMHAQLVNGDTPWTRWLSEPHAGNTTSDGILALIEGYAEYMAAYLTGRETIASDPDGALTRNLYVYEPSGALKDPEDMWKTEGWAATVLLEIAKTVPGGMEKIHEVMRSSNPETFKELIEGLQERYPADRAAIQSIVSEKSLGKIYPDAVRTDPGTTTSGSYAPGGDRTVLADGLLGSSGWDAGKAGKIVAAVAGGVLGVTFGVSFGPVGMVVAGALGAVAGNYLAGLVMDRDPAAESYDWNAWSPLAGGGASSYVSPYATPSSPTPADPETARQALEEAYGHFLDLMGRGSAVHSKEVEAARQVYESARRAYDAALAGAR